MLSVGQHSVKVSQGISDGLFVWLQLHQKWLLASHCLLLCHQECTAVFVQVYLGWWKIRCHGTSGIHYPVVVALLGYLLGVPWCFVCEHVICMCEYLAGPVLVQVCRAFAYDVTNTSDSMQTAGNKMPVITVIFFNFQTSVFTSRLRNLVKNCSFFNIVFYSTLIVITSRTCDTSSV